ncbi:MAG: energy transducer TonB [Methylophilaceae bacterium]|nr:energy transducer TonB [Methylophilaceae bacterium]
MNWVNSHNKFEQRSASLGVLVGVLAIHAALAWSILTVRIELPVLAEYPIQVSLVAPEPEASPFKPDVPPQVIKPVLKPQPKLKVKPEEQKPQPEPVRELAKPVEQQGIHAPASQSAQLAEASTTASLQLPEQRGAPSAEETKTAERHEGEVPEEQPRFDADYLDNPAPGYPSLSRKLREEGLVLLRVRVDATGQPVQVSLHQSSGFERLDERALQTVKRWKFVPAKRGGQAVEAWVIVPILFSLKG